MAGVAAHPVRRGQVLAEDVAGVGIEPDDRSARRGGDVHEREWPKIAVEAQFVVVWRVVVQIEERREIEIFVNGVGNVGSGDDLAVPADPAVAAIGGQGQELDVDLVGDRRAARDLDRERCSGGAHRGETYARSRNPWNPSRRRSSTRT